MATPLPATLQTLYAELVERCAQDRLDRDFDVGGSFFRKTRNGRVYWYFRSPMAGGERSTRYVGPDSPELGRLIEAHGAAKGDYRERRRLVTALQRAGLRGPDPLTGRVLQALSDAGVFRMRAVVVGSVAYQTYGGLLGVVTSARNAQTEDLDIAQFPSIKLQAISLAVEDAADMPLGEILAGVDPRFRPAPSLGARAATRFVLDGGRYRVDVLTPNRGPDSDEPVALPAIGGEGQPMRFLDFLIYQEVRAVALHGEGVLVNVPAPERFALHKLLLGRARVGTGESQAKSAKDLRQAAELISVLADQRPYELRDLWRELNDRGPKWRRMASEAARMMEAPARDRFEGVVGPLGA
jgi:hypothetical protein